MLKEDYTNIMKKERFEFDNFDLNKLHEIQAELEKQDKEKAKGVQN